MKLAEDDIYCNKRKYEAFKKNIRVYLKPVSGKRQYQILCPENIKYFDKLFLKMEARDNAYIRRLRLARTFLIVCYFIDKELSQVTRDDIDNLMVCSYERNKTVSSRKDFVIDVKFLWKLLLPDKDKYGRDDETITPYVVRHLSSRVDKSRQKNPQG